ncbi:MAG TPA: hypothetical protein VIE66_11455 [Methylocella sp.]
MGKTSHHSSSRLGKGDKQLAVAMMQQIVRLGFLPRFEVAEEAENQRRGLAAADDRIRVIWDNGMLSPSETL